MRREEAEALVAQGAEAVLGVVRSLEERIEELERRLSRDSTNSSLPASRDPPLTRQHRRAPARERAKASLRKPGGQPGHEGKARELAAPERVTAGFDHLPAGCGCGHRFDGAEQRLGEPVVQHTWELPVIVREVVEHRRWRLACLVCGKGALAELPDGVSASALGPRLEAHIAVLAGVYRLSRRQIADIVTHVFGCPISVGAIDATIMRMSRALADPWAELRDAVRQADAVYADETSWRLRGQTNWLWVAASALLACYRIDPSRSQRAAKNLLGEDFGSFAITDRYVGYHWLDVLQQQLCWAHAIRQFTDLSERPGAPGRLGRKLLAAAREVFAIHRAYLQEGRDLAWLKAELDAHRDRIEQLLKQGARGPAPQNRPLLPGPARRVRRAVDVLRGPRHRPHQQRRRTRAAPRRDPGAKFSSARSLSAATAGSNVSARSANPAAYRAGRSPTTSSTSRPPRSSTGRSPRSSRPDRYVLTERCPPPSPEGIHVGHADTP